MVIRFAQCKENSLRGHVHHKDLFKFQQRADSNCISEIPGPPYYHSQWAVHVAFHLRKGRAQPL